MSAVYIEVIAGVRYWEDATVNGVEDTDGKLIPFRVFDSWRPVIRLPDGVFMDWPEGVSADIHYKVCDDGEYWLLDESLSRVGKWAGYYVPDQFLCHGDNGFGDYIIMKVDGQGAIQNYRTPVIEWVGEDSESQTGWKPVAAEIQRQRESK